MELQFHPGGGADSVYEAESVFHTNQLVGNVYKSPAFEPHIIRQTEFYSPCKLPYEVRHTGFLLPRATQV